MKKIFILTAAFAALSFVSCVKEQEVNGPVTVFSATQADMSTKTVIGAADADGCYQPLWTNSDKIKINNLESKQAVLKDGGKEAAFTLEGELSAPYFAVSPATAFDAREFDQSGNKMNVFVSGTGSPQRYTVNGENVTYSANAALMVAHGESTALEFHHLMAYYKLEITGGDANIKTIYVRQNGEQPNIAGSWNVVFDEQNAITFSPKDLTSVIVYNCGETGIETGKPVLVAVPAYDFESGLILTVKDVKGKFQSYGIPAASAKLADKAGVIINKSLAFNPQSGTINNAEDWEAFADAVNSEKNDWDLYRWVGDGTVKIGQSFTIKNPTKIRGKNGKFLYNVDGGGNTITVEDGTGPLFRGVRKEIKNLTVDGNFVFPGKEVAAFADSLLSGGSIVNCTNKAALSSTSTADGGQYGGGIVRVLFGGGTITGCKNEGTITLTPDASNAFANCYVGGIVGQICQTEAVTISNCSNNAAITVKPKITNANYNITCAGIGGIAGWVRNVGHNVTFDNCDNLANGDITVSAEQVTVDAYNSAVCVGGIVGIAAGYEPLYHALYKNNIDNGLDITMKLCDNSGDIYNCAYSRVQSQVSNMKVYTGGLAGALMGDKSKNIKVLTCTVRDCCLIPYDIVNGTSRAAFCAVVGGAIGYGGYVDIDDCIVDPVIGNGKRQSVSFAGMIGFAMRPFIIQNSYVYAQGYFSRVAGFSGNRAAMAVVPVKYNNSDMDPVANVSGSKVTNCKIGGCLMLSATTLPEYTDLSDLSSSCNYNMFPDVNNTASNLVCGQKYTQADAKADGVTFSGLAGWTDRQ